MAHPKIIVVGGGLAGLAATIKIAEMGGHVDLFSIVPVKRSHSVCAQGGINAAKNLKGEGDSTWQHFDDTVYGGDFLANQPPVKAMCDAAPGIIDLLDRMGVPFNRTPEGLLDFRRFGGTLYQPHRVRRRHHRPATALRARRAGAALRIRRQGHQVRSLGVPLRRHRRSARLPRHLRHRSAQHAGAHLPGRSRHHGHRRQRRHLRQVDQLGGLHRLGAVGAVSAGRVLRQRRVHPGAPDLHSRRRQAAPDVGVGARRRRPRLGAASSRATSAIAKSIPESERWYFLEEWYPKYGNLVPRDIATRAIHKVVYEHHLGIDGQPMVYLDLTHIDREMLDRKLEGILEIYEKFVGDDPRDAPMKIFPGMHYTMGGLWVDFEQKTNIEGLYAAGECDYSIHGANRLGANSLLSCIYGGFVAGPNAVKYAHNVIKSGKHAAGHVFDSERKRQEEINAPPDEQRWHGESVPAVARAGRDDDQERVRSSATTRTFSETDAKLVELLERYRHVNLSDKSMWANTSFVFTRQLYNMLQLARVIAQGAAMRDESRGAHYKPDFPERDDANWLKTTKAYFAADADEPRFEFEQVDTSLIKPRPRRYDAAT